MTSHNKIFSIYSLKKLFLLIVLVTITHFSYADTVKPQIDHAWLAMTSSAGLWHGKIYFKNNQELPSNLRLNNELTPDHATIISYLTFENNNNKRYAMELMTYNQKNKQLYESYFENGHAVNHIYNLDYANFKDTNHWTINYDRIAKHDSNNVKIKLTWQREGNRIIRKEIICEGTNTCQLNRETRLVLKSNA